MFTDDTIRQYFIQRFNKNSTIQDILNHHLTTLNDNINITLGVDVINQKNEHMWRCEKNLIPKFITLYH